MATWKKVVVSGSAISALNNDANYLQSGDTVAELTGSFTGSFTGDGSGLTGVVASSANTLNQGGGIQTFSYDGSTSGVTIKVDSGSLAGNGLEAGAGLANLAVKAADTTISVVAGGISVVEANLSGIPTTALTADDITLGTTNVTLGGTAASIVGLTSLEAVSITGSFKGDGSEITGIASTLGTAGETGTGTIALKTQSLTIAAGEGINTVASGQTITVSGEDASAANKGVASFSDSNFTVTAGDVVLSNDVAINQNLVVNNNLTVLGTASFQSTTNLDVADRWIRMASGSNTVGDGGLAIQQTGPLDAEGFGYDSAVARWGITGSFDAAQSAIIPDAFMASVVEGAASDPTAVVAKYTKKGNIFVGANQDIYIYS